MPDSLRPHGLQHATLPCPSPTPGAFSNSCPLSQWCHPTISFSVISFSSCLQSFPASQSFSMSQLFISGGQSIRASASTSVLPMNIQGWFPLGLTDWISLQSKWLSRVFSNTTVWRHWFFRKKALILFHCPALTSVYEYWKNYSFDYMDLFSQVMSLLFNILSRFVIAFLPKRNASFNFMAAVTIHSDFGAQENRVSHCFHCFPIYLPWSDGTRGHDLCFWPRGTQCLSANIETRLLESILKQPWTFNF